MMITPAAPQDLREVIEFLIYRFHASYAEFFPPVNVEKVIHSAASAIDTGIVYLARTKDGELAGVISGRITTPWFSDTAMATDGFFFVAPEHRGTRAASALVKALQAWATEKGLELTCSVSSGDDVDRKDRFFHKQNFQRIGGIYRHKGF